MARYSAFIALASGDYREVDELIEAPDPRTAAQHLIDSGAIETRDDFPIILIVEEQAISLFTRDPLGEVATPTEDISRRLAERRDLLCLHVLDDDSPDVSE